MSAAKAGAALKARLDTLAFTPAMPVAWPNRDAVQTSGRYLHVDFVRAENQRLTISGHHRQSGSIVVTVVTNGGRGSGEGDGIADAVAAHFPCDLVLTSGGVRVRITARPTIREGFIDASAWRTPVVIPFEILN